MPIPLNAQNDGNTMKSLIAWDPTGGTTRALTCDPSTGALLVTSAGAFTGDAWSSSGPLTLTNTVVIKASAANLRYAQAWNPNASGAYLQVFNTATPTLGVTAPVVSFYIPAMGGWSDNMNFNFSTALSAAATTTQTGGTAVSSGLQVTVGYI